MNQSFQTIDYLIIGHLTRDIKENGNTIGGTACYAALTARNLGYKVGIITSFNPELDTSALQNDQIQILNIPSENTTTFSNRYHDGIREQKILNQAEMLSIKNISIPQEWQNPSILHLGPVAQEVSTDFLETISAQLTCITPQGWMRKWDQEGNIQSTKWEESTNILPNIDLSVFSIEDINYKETWIDEMIPLTKILAVTEAFEGARLYWNGDIRYFKARMIEEVDPTGAGDIFAAGFFTRFLETRDAWEAARFANQMASFSVTRSGLSSIPTTHEIKSAKIEIL